MSSNTETITLEDVVRELREMKQATGFAAARISNLEEALGAERAARQALEDQIRQSRYEKGLSIALQRYKMSISRSCKKDYLRYRPHYSC
jgi:hypothetical protein